MSSSSSRLRSQFVFGMSLGGTEQFHSDGREAGFGVLDFWRWSASDLLVNTQRGVVAEYLVARALGVMDSLQTSQWAGWDILGPGRVRIEVKSAAYWQSWSQEKPSEITFQIGPRKWAWDPVREDWLKLDPPRRAADVDVFCLLGREGDPRPDPLDLDQWRFFVVPTFALDEEFGSQKSIALGRLMRLLARKGRQPVGYDDLRQTISAIRRLDG